MKYGSAVILTLLLPAVALGQAYSYPNKGQSAQQQDKDRYECHTWAVQQTGFDPTRAQAAPAPSSPQPGGEIVRGSAESREGKLRFSSPRHPTLVPRVSPPLDTQ